MPRASRAPNPPSCRATTARTPQPSSQRAATHTFAPRLEQWTEHHKFGTQLQVESSSGLETGATPSTAEGMEELLCSPAIKGVGPKLAAALVQALPTRLPPGCHPSAAPLPPLWPLSLSRDGKPTPHPEQEFGESTLDVLLNEEREEELLRVPGMGPKTLERVRTSARQWADSRDALSFGLSLGLSGAQAYALVKKHGANSEAKVAAHPPHMLEANPGPNPSPDSDLSPSP